MRGCIIRYFPTHRGAVDRLLEQPALALERGLRAADLIGRAAGSEVYFCASFLAQTKKERSATSGLIHKAAVQISLM